MSYWESPQHVPPSPDISPSVHIARQPIFDAAGAVFGYELLYRAARQDESCADASDIVAVRALNDAVLALGLEVADWWTAGVPEYDAAAAAQRLRDAALTEGRGLEVLETRQTKTA